MRTPIFSKNSTSANKKWSVTLKKAEDPALCKAANAARIRYLLIVVLSIFGGMFIDFRFIGAGDASVVMTKIQEGEWLYRLGKPVFLPVRSAKCLLCLHYLGCFSL